MFNVRGKHGAGADVDQPARDDRLLGETRGLPRECWPLGLRPVRTSGAMRAEARGQAAGLGQHTWEKKDQLPTCAAPDRGTAATTCEGLPPSPSPAGRNPGQRRIASIG
ncbi:hypothetical protein Afe04nite_53890 [Asanoa ferruginea]|nr:hypothetical protein Afe04nite_53890 [Asanoa ferruginea]